MINSELFKTLVNLLNNLLKIVDAVVEKTGAIPLAFIAAVKILEKNKTYIFNDKDILSKFYNIISKIKLKAKNTEIKVDVTPNVQGVDSKGLKKLTHYGGSQSTSNVSETAQATTGLMATLKAGLVAATIWAGIEVLKLAFNEFFRGVEKAKEKVSNLANEYQDVTSEIETINSKLEENQKKIDEINANELDFTGNELEELQKQNEELKLQKQYLEDIAEIKKQQLNNATEDLLELENYTSENQKQNRLSAVWEQLLNGEYEKALGTYSAFGYNEKDNSFFRAIKNIGNVASAIANPGYLLIDAFDKTDANITAGASALEQIKSLKKLNETKQNLLKTNDNIDYKTYFETNKQIEEINDSLIDTISYLTEQQKTLDENSKKYQEINDIIKEYQNISQQIKKDKNGFIDLSLETYFNADDFDQKEFEKVQDTITKNNYTGYKTKAVFKHFKEGLSKEVQNILQNNNIKVTGSIDPLAPEYIDTNSYRDILNTLQDINQLKQQGLWTDSQSNQILEETLYKMAGINEEQFKYVELASKLEAYSFINKFLNGDNAVDIHNLNQVGADTYVAFKEAILQAAQNDGQDTGFIDNVIASLFPDYQTVESRMKQYVKKNPGSALNYVVNNYIKGKGLPNSYNSSLIEEFEDLGVSADDAAYYIEKLTQAIIKERKEELKSKTNDAIILFNTNKTNFDDNFVDTQTAFTNAISNIASGSSISYEDMWTLIGVDPTLVDKFSKSIDGYTISIKNLIDAQNKYKQETKDTFKTEIENSQKRISEYQNELEDAKQRLEKVSGNRAKQKEIDTIDFYNELIDEENELLAKNSLMYEEVSDSMSLYTQQLENAVNMLSTYKSLYESIANDMSKIGRIGAESMVELIQTFPENWQKLVKKSGDGFVLDDVAYTQTVIQKFGFSGGDKTTIAKDLNNEIENKLQSLADKYSITYEKGSLLADQFSEIAGNAAKSGIDLGNFYNEFNNLETEFKDTNNVASIFADIIKTIIDSFKESKALTDFNNKIDELQHKFNMGWITQAEYDSQFAAASDAYINAAEVEGVSDAETQPQIWSNQEQIHSAQQSAYQKQLDKEKQDLQDAYDRKLISAKDYYRELSKLEDKYYGKKNDLISPDELERLRSFNKEMQKTYGLGNVDLTKRPKVNAETMRKAGYEADDGETATVYSSFDFIWQGDEKNGKYVAVHYTPILPDGTVLDDESLRNYLYDTLETSENILEEDKNNLGVVLKVDTDLNITDEDIKSLETDKPTQNILDIIKACDDWDIALHDVQEQWVNLEREISATEIAAGLLDDPDGMNTEEKNRRMLEIRASLANDEFAKLQAEYSRGLKGFDQVEAEIKNSLDYWLGDTKELAQQYKDLSREVSSFLYESEVSLADKQLEQGLMSNTKYAKEMLRVWKKYYKDKEGYAEESYQAEQKFMDAAKSSVQNYIDGIENLISQNEDFINTQIDALEEQNDEIEKEYDKQIKAIEEQIDAIDKKNDEEERHLELLKAEEALEKAKRNKRLVFDSMGNQQYRADTQSIKEAQDELDKVKREEEKAKLQDEIDKLEKEKEEKLEENNKKIEELNNQLKTLNKPLEDLAAVLAYNLAETYDIDPKVIAELLSSEASQEKMGKINEALKAAGKEEITVEGLKQTANDAAKQNKQQTDTTTKNGEIAVAYGGSYTVNGNLHGIQTDSDNKSQAQEVSVLSIDGVNYKVIADSVSSIDSNLSELLDSPVNWNFNPGETMYATSAASTVVPNVSTNQLSVSIGDININNPVGDSMNLAQEISKQLPNAFTQQIYKNK